MAGLSGRGLRRPVRLRSVRLGRITLLAIAVGCCVRAEGQERPPPPALKVSVDPRVELMSIIFRLAGFDEYKRGRVPSYAADVDAHFGTHADHPVIKLAQRLRQSDSIGYDACMSIAVHLDAEKLTPRRPWNDDDPSLEHRWKPVSAEEFAREARRFAADSGFTDFFRAHGPLYATSVSAMERVLTAEAHLEWFEEFYGSRPSAEFRLVLGMLNGPANHGVRFVPADGAEEAFCIFGVEETDAAGTPVFRTRVAETVAHEFSHSFVNHVVETHRASLKPSGEALFEAVEAEMRRLAYGNWKIMIDESLVRAATVRYLLKYSGPTAAEKQITYEVDRNRFLWMRELVDLLATYEQSRRQYPRFESFMPRVVEFFDEHAPKYVKAIDDRRKATAGHEPKVVSVSPASGATDVDPTTPQIVVTFDRPMKPGGYSVMYLGPDGPDHFPKFSGKPAYDETGRVLTFTVQLKPEWSYRFSLNDEAGGAFKSREGVPLARYDVTFTTGRPR